MPKPTKYSAVSERMPSRYTAPRGSRGTELGEAVFYFKKEDLTASVKETVGACKNTQKKVRRGSRRTRICNEFNTTLGNGFCMECWDKEVERLHNNAVQRKKKNDLPEATVSILPSDI